MPAQRTLAQTVAGRTLLDALELHRRGSPRAETITWFSAGPPLTSAGHRVPAAAWKRISCEAGASRGIATWQHRLTIWVDSQRNRECSTPESAAGRERRTAQAEQLSATLQALDDACATALSAPTWSDAATAAGRLLHACLGTSQQVAGWGPSTGVEQAAAVERDAYAAVEEVLTSLSSLDGAAPTGLDAVRDAISDLLTAAVPAGTTLGRGVLVGPVSALVGIDVDLLLVVGMSEDTFPARQREHPMLRDADRVLLSSDLATVASRRRTAERHWDRLLASSPAVELSYPRANTRSQRRQFASPWFLRETSRLAGGPVRAGQLEAVTAPWLTVQPSFVAALAATETYTSSQELDIANALTGGVDQLAAHDERLRRGLEAARARAEGTWGEWTGGVGALPDPVRAEVDLHHSASSLQTWAACPASHFFAKVLRVEQLDDRGAADSIEARDRGTLLHGVLEEFLTPHLRTEASPGRDPDAPWTEEEHAQAQQLLLTHAQELADKGRAGRHPLVWQVELATFRRALRRTLREDDRTRRERRSRPVALEAAFGRDEAPWLEVELPTQGVVRFAGFVDRIDVTDDEELVVIDYKAGRGEKYLGVTQADVVHRGQVLQLPLYGLAARMLHGEPTTAVSAWFSFLENGKADVGFPIDDHAVDRLHDVLELAVSSIREGVAPANPGDWDAWSGFEACRYCAFDRVCPSTRGEQWEAVRDHPAVAPYRQLAEPDE